MAMHERSDGNPLLFRDSAGRSLLKPLSILAILIVIALAVAFVVNHRGGQAASAQENPNPAPTLKPVITNDGWIKGNPEAKTVLVEFGDFQCPSCAMARLKVAEVLKKHEHDLKVVFKQYPMQNAHRNAMLAAQVAEAAGRQAKFWEMSELLFSKQSDWANVPDPMTFFVKYAAELQLNLAKFQSDVTEEGVRSKIFRDMLEGQLAQVHSVPTFFLNGTVMDKIKSEADFYAQIDNAVRSAK
ncbi:MAG: thioredoxin domain-containing protein [Terriglobia bacterium]